LLVTDPLVVWKDGTDGRARRRTRLWLWAFGVLIGFLAALLLTRESGPALTLGAFGTYVVAGLLVTRWLARLTTEGLGVHGTARRIVTTGWFLTIVGLVVLVVWILVNFPGKAGVNIAGTPSEDIGDSPPWAPAIIGVSVSSLGGLFILVGVLLNRQQVS
jgi:hypothetical protein